MAKIKHRRGNFATSLHHKTDWLRRQRTVDMNVVETVELAADVIERIEVRTNAGYAKLEAQLGQLRSRVAELEQRLGS